MLYFFETYVHNNKNINTIVINNFGNMNYDKESYQKLKVCQKKKLPNLKQIIYDNNIFNENIKEIVNNN